MISTAHMDATRVCRLVWLLNSFFIDPLKRESIIIFTNTYTFEGCNSGQAFALLCSANVLGGKIGNFVRVDIIINMQT